MARFDPAVDVVRATSREIVVAVWPSHSQTFRSAERSPSRSGKAAGMANNICPR